MMGSQSDQRRCLNNYDRATALTFAESAGIDDMGSQLLSMLKLGFLFVGLAS